MKCSNKHCFNSHRRRFWLLLFPLALSPLALSAETTDTLSSDSRAAELESPVEKTQIEEEVTEAAREREKSGEEDPLMQRQADRVDRPVEWSDEPNEFNFYGSARIRYRETDTDSVWGDGGSRVGVSGQWQYKPFSWVFGRVEAGVNILDQIDLLLDRGGSAAGSKFGDTVFLRLAYVGIETPGNMLTIGKNWSTYYQVTSFTDRFQGAGGSASGTYNAGTDGGYTGTGRADGVLQTRVLVDTSEGVLGFKPFKLNLQIQYGEPIPHIDNVNYKTTVGVSALLETREDFTAGLAYNHANVDSADLDVLASSGIDGDATALALGLRWFSDNWYLGTVVVRLENHEATDEIIYFDGMGWEVYANYRLYKRWWVVGGWNKLTPDSSEVQAGEFKGDYSVVGIRYSFREFQQLVFANVRIDSGAAQDGTGLGNIYTIGVRWDFP